VRVIFAGNWLGQIELGVKQLAENCRLAPVFVPLRNLVWTAVAVRNFLNPQKPYRASVPVISVGNITVGGTGKTPFVKWLVQRLAEIGQKPAVLTPLSENADEVKEHESENLSRSETFPVFPGRDRVKNARRAVEVGATVIVLDDGFQFRSLHRDVDIVLWDAMAKFSPNNPLLREPLVGLRRATCIVLSKADALGDEERETAKRRIERWAGDGKVVASFGYEPVGLKLVAGGKLLEGERFRPRKVLLVAGVANPLYFSLTAIKFGVNPVAMVCFPDHHRYNLADAEFVAKFAESERADAVLTTRKDAVKLSSLWRSEIPLFALEVKLRWLQGEDEIWGIVERAIRS